jgi:hypothetical protein
MGKRLHFDLLERIKNTEHPQESSVEENKQTYTEEEKGAE